MLTKFGEILGILQIKIVQIQFLGISWNYFQDFPKAISWDILRISKFTNQDLNPIVVNILTTIYNTNFLEE